MSEVIFRIVRDDGNIFLIDDTDWRIPSDGLSGWHSTNTNVTMFENTMADGSMITQQRVPAVERTITVEARDTSASDHMRTLAEMFFIPHKNYKVFATYMGRTRKFEGVQAAFTLSEGNIHRPVSFAWTLSCQSPYSSDPELKVGQSPYSILYHGSGMPYRSLGYQMKNDRGVFHKGFVTGAMRKAPNVSSNMNKDDLIALVNDGNVRTRPTFWIQAQRVFEGASGFNGAKLYIRLQEVKDKDGTYIYTGRNFIAEVPNWVYGGDDPSESGVRNLTDYLKIDFASRPFRLESMAVNGSGEVVSTRREHFEVEDDSLIKDPYLYHGETVFNVHARILNKNNVAQNVKVSKYATIECLYTGV